MADEQKTLDKLDTLIKLVAVGVVKDLPLNDQVARLSAAGMQPAEIARALGKTANHISVTLNKLRKPKKNE